MGAFIQKVNTRKYIEVHILHVTSDEISQGYKCEGKASKAAENECGRRYTTATSIAISKAYTTSMGLISDTSSCYTILTAHLHKVSGCLLLPIHPKYN